MEKIFEKDNQHLTRLQKAKGDDMLRVLAWRPENGKPHYYMKGDSTLSYFECNEVEKIQMEISRWSNALSNAFADSGNDRSLYNLSPALHSILKTQPQKEVKGLFARTLRMLLFLESVLLGEKCTYDNPYSCVITNNIYTSLNKLVKDLSKIKVSEDSALESYNENWVVSLPLLLVVTVGESQCELIQPFAWEAYSAARARDELRRRWPGMKETVLNTVALLIRYQSAVGQKARQSGTPKFIDLLDQTEKVFAFDRDRLIKSLQLLAVIEETRNHKVPNGTNYRDFDINAECDQEWDNKVLCCNIKKYLNFNSSSDSSPPPNDELKNHTWSYFRPRYLGMEQSTDADADVEAFKRTILLTRKDCTTYDIISVGRNQTQRPLKALMGKIIKGWSTIENKKKRFEKFFRLQPLSVPHPFSMNNKEDILQVLLRDDLAAECLLFPSNNIDELFDKHNQTEHLDTTNNNAGELFDHLLKVAKTKMGLNQDAIWEEKARDGHFPALEKPLYVPFPLVRRITNIIFSLQSSTCFNIPIRIDRSTIEWVHLPYGISKDDHLNKRVLASFLLSTVLNRAMSSGLSRAEIDLENLSIPSLTKGNEETDNNSERLMQPKDWRKTIQHLYVDGGYNVLLDRYLRDYNSQRKSVHFETRLSPDTQFGSDKLNTLAVGDICKDLKQYLASESNRKDAKNKGKGTSTPDFWLLGVDIGGTLIKCQLFGFFNCSETFKELDPVFRMSTTPESRKPFSGQDSITESTDEYATRLVELIKKRAGSKLEQINHSRLVIGLAWPGPVREDHLNGTSGLLKEFGLSHIILQNRIDDIWKIDIVGAVSRAWKKEFNNDKIPFISLLNDGDADAVGAVVLANNHGSNEHTNDNVLSVIKLGTGLAGAILKTFDGHGLSLIPGLYEWGKIVLDVAAPPNSGFPQGVAGEYLSKKCLPRLAELWGKKGGFFQYKDAPDSAEIGLILETADSSEPDKAYNKLLVECGSIQGNRRPMYGVPVSAEVLRVVYRNPEENPDLLHEVRLALRQFANVEAELKTHLENYGRIRLDRLISPNQTLFKRKFKSKEADEVRKLPRFKAARDIALQCAESLGHFLGDLCVLLNDELGVKEVRLTGGVLSGKTRECAVEAACKRIRLYGLNMQALPTGAFAIGALDDNSDYKNNSQQTQYNSIDIERGAFGAACFAAASFIQDKKQKGLQRLRSLLLEVRPGETINIEKTQLIVNGKDSGIDFRGHALSERDLQKFLEVRGPDCGFYQADSPASFVRWK